MAHTLTSSTPDIEVNGLAKVTQFDFTSDGASGNQQLHAAAANKQYAVIGITGQDDSAGTFTITDGVQSALLIGGANNQLTQRLGSPIFLGAVGNKLEINFSAVGRFTVFTQEMNAARNERWRINAGGL